MNYRRLGRTGLKVSPVGLGTWQYCGDWGKDFTVDEVRGILDRASELGFNMIDSAAGYGPNHLSEHMIGEVLEGNRDKWVISTKFGRYRTGVTEDTVVCDFSAEAVKGQLEDSLRALRTDHIDIYLMHSAPTDKIANDELWTMLDKAKAEGKIGCYGLSLGGTNTLKHSQMAHTFGCDVVMMIYNALDNGPGKDGTLDFCQSVDLGVMARVPLAQGYLSGKYKPGAKFEARDVRSYYYSEEVTQQRIAKAIDIIGNQFPSDVTPANWAMAWAVNHPAVGTCVAGFKSIAQLEGGAKATEYTFSNHPLAWDK